MIVITGANGRLGRLVVERLLARVPAERIVASVRDSAKAIALHEAGVTVRRADFADDASLRDAFGGADAVLIVSADKLGQEALDLHRSAIAAARAAGVGRVLYTSHVAARIGSPFVPADQHAGTERQLADGGAPFTTLRHGFYAESCLQMIGDGLRTGLLQTPADGPVTWTSRADLAEADAAILTDAARWDGATPPLVARESLAMADVARIASEISGRAIEHRVVGDREWVDAKIAGGVPPPYARMMLGFFEAARNGDFAAVDPTLEALIGRPPRALREVLATELAAADGSRA